MKQTIKVFITGLFLFTITLGCSKEDEIPDPNAISATITANNVGTSAYIFTSIEGSGATSTLNMDNAALTLKIGSRYQIINLAGLPHPFTIRGIGNTTLLAQNDVVGTFESNSAVNFIATDTGITFTLTAEMAAQIAPYQCGRHAAMTGNISAIN
ncbi:hypothetical protein Belba_3512 [Belliella baltica DSM 15883]|uniref:Uncharacterized protein n=1 Tax=Belliella baltica (strain DSM 15883 / CIP 108006 / LMG 21964 / BA134) TaxID=866536 RepID=I3Z9U5_BELBD|nr:hypothetical protein [Belliella baltica]AFL86013.1 hypothetical protein Belba_3512 [Belliella baltica DSM 15883]